MPRAYDSGVRRAQALQTRRSVIDAAVVVFAELGWQGTTMLVVAQRAGVAVETVYRTVPGGKASLLIEAVHAAVAGGAEHAESASEDRPGIRRAVRAVRAREALRAYAATLPGTWRRVGPLLGVLEVAGPDPSLVGLRSRLEDQRLEGMRSFAQRLESAGDLRNEISLQAAADVLWTVCALANHRALVDGRGWSENEYVDWVVRALSGELLDRHD